MQMWDKVSAANLNGQWDITSALLPALKHAGASVILVASIAAFTAPGSSAAFVTGVTFLSMLEFIACSWRTVMSPTESLTGQNCVAQFQHKGRQRPDPDSDHQSTNVLTHFSSSVNIRVVRIERVIRKSKSVRTNDALSRVGGGIQGGL
jgi:hypothetical protein